MHRVLWFIVTADDQEHAVDVAEEAFEAEFIERRNTSFDYCKPMHPGSVVSGAGRWDGFRDEPNAAKLESEQGQEWIREALEHTQEHFAENLFGFVSHAQLRLADDNAETDIVEVVETIKENNELAHDDGAELLLDTYPDLIESLWNGGGMHRYFADQMGEEDPFVAHIVDCVSYNDPLLIDGSMSIGTVNDRLNEPPEDAWVVPLDTHF